jgi:hypothetical protein
MSKKSLFIVAFFFVSVSTFAQIPKGYKLVYAQTFEKSKSVDDFVFTQPGKWKVSDGNPGYALEFTGKSDYEPPFRSPHTIGVIKNLKVASFILEVDLLQTGREYGHRDMIIAFGLQDSSHFYYSHIASQMDDNAHQVMIVNGAPRTKISTFASQGVDWGNNEWRKIRIERNADEGSIKIYFNGKLVEEANDKTFSFGYIGFGSFDDSGKIDNIRIWSPKADRRPLKIFSGIK